MSRRRLAILALVFVPPALAATVTLRPAKDATIYSPVGGASAPGDANLANGKSDYLFAGRNGESRALRSLIAFDLTGQIPPGATITSATLRLPVNTPHTDYTTTLRAHRINADWSEGTVAAGSGGGSGASATPGSVTWLARSLGTATWTTRGGDFAAAPSASQLVASTAPLATITSPGLAGDVQAWLANPAANFGWMLIAADESAPAVRFGSREAVAAPTLVVEFESPGEPPPSGGAARLANLSVRTALDSGQTLIVGFAVAGGGTRDLLVRGVGPALAAFGLAGSMADPRLELYRDTTLVAQNDDWGGGAGLSNAFAGVGAFAFPAGSRDAALLQPTDGARSVQLKGTGAGVVLLELYDTGGAGTARLFNVSARNRVGTGDNVLICGFVVSGNGSRNLLVRAVGPTLAAFGVTGLLADPRIDVFRAGTGASIAGNDNWAGTLAPAFATVGAFALAEGSRDAALITGLTAGSYTVQVSGVAGGTGEALVEIYELP
ncbi:MAG: DNRLRE domain-containing protein [Opitutaceae bacterium]|nr:DNRLRE domain-containing protein [Opitutaceae bacterium]